MSSHFSSTVRLLLVAAPALVALLLVLLAGVPEGGARWLLLIVVLILSMTAAYMLRGMPGHWTRTLANLVEGLREGDYSVRAWVPRNDDEYAALVGGFNRLAAHLHDERHNLHETLQLLSKTLATLDSAVFAFEGDARLRMVNPAGERLLGLPATMLLGQSAVQLGLEALFSLPSGSIHAQVFDGQAGRWRISHSSLRSRSQAGSLLVIQPMERALREEEAHAFRRLLRVLSHEINNSLAPIASMADTLQRLIPAEGTELDGERRVDLTHGLELIEQRSGALQRFLGGYARLAKLPAPQQAPLRLADVCQRVQRLLDDTRVTLHGDLEQTALADGDQLEQVLINLLRNALEADASHGKVQLNWRTENDQVIIEVIDSGPGLPASDSLFVPFFTTKPSGSGIGLVLSRQVIEAQHGSLTLRTRQDASGTVATVRLPVPSQS